jgi:hypothetical protein
VRVGALVPLGGLQVSASLTKYEREQGLDKLGEAEALLAIVESIPDAKQIADQADAVRLYMRKANLGLSNQNRAAAIAIKARKKAGEIAKLIERKLGGRPEKTSITGEASSTPLQQAAKEANISKPTLERWQTLAAETTDAEIDEAAHEATANGRELTTADVLNKKAVKDYAEKFEADISTVEGQFPGFIRDTMDLIRKKFSDPDSIIPGIPERCAATINTEAVRFLASYFTQVESVWEETWTH